MKIKKAQSKPSLVLTRRHSDLRGLAVKAMASQFTGCEFESRYGQKEFFIL